jgi:hypothetical protein
MAENEEDLGASARFDAELLAWLRALQPTREETSGSDFSQGVIRGFEIVIAQIENGHHRKYIPALASQSAAARTALEQFDAANCACTAAERYVPTCPKHGGPPQGGPNV